MPKSFFWSKWERCRAQKRNTQNIMVSFKGRVKAVSAADDKSVYLCTLAQILSVWCAYNDLMGWGRTELVSGCLDERQQDKVVIANSLILNNYITAQEKALQENLWGKPDAHRAQCFTAPVLYSFSKRTLSKTFTMLEQTMAIIWGSACDWHQWFSSNGSGLVHC